MKKFFPIILVAIVVGVLSFYGGYKYGFTKKTSGQFGTFQNQQGRIGNRQIGMNIRAGGGENGGGMVNGSVVSKDQSSITVQLGNNGGSKLVLFSTSTLVRQSSEVSLDQVKVGENVSIRGQQNSDGSITANSIQLIPFGGNTSSFSF